MRAVDRGDTVANDELKLSLAEHEDAREIDIERLKEIFAMILDFISQLLALFSMFAYDDDVIPTDRVVGLMNVAPEVAPAPDQGKPDQCKPDQARVRKDHRKPLRTRIKTPRKGHGKVLVRVRHNHRDCAA